MRFPLPYGLTAGYVAVAFLAPVWISALRGNRSLCSVAAVGLGAVGMGLLLLATTGPERTVHPKDGVVAALSLIGIVASICFISWSRTFLSTNQIALVYGCGMLVGLLHETTQFAVNPWKYGFQVPLTLIALALAARSGNRRIELALVVVLAVTSGASDSRSVFAVLGVVAVLLLWQSARRRTTGRTSTLLVIVALAVFCWVGYVGAERFILAGGLGGQTQARSVEQVDASGSLLLGGRPELAATRALFEHGIWGFGGGVGPSRSDVDAAKAGMRQVGYQPDNNYVAHYMFGGRVELHSLVGDLWAIYGLVGLLLAAIVAGVVVSRLARGISRGTSTALTLYLQLIILWDLAFAPLYSATPLLILALGLFLREPAGERHERDAVETAAPLSQ